MLTPNIKITFSLMMGKLTVRNSGNSYIKSIRKDQHGVAPLNVDGTPINNSKDKAEALNCQFQSVFTHED